MSLLIKGGTVVNADREERADVLLGDDGKIAAVGPDLEAPTGAETIDAHGCLVMPGGIDPHTHMEMPFMGTHSADDFETGTRAALSGGTTFLVDFVLPGQGQSLLEALQQWDDKAGIACCDYSYHMAVTWWSDQVSEEMGRVVERGINTFKHFMAYKGALMVDDGQMFHSFRRCAELGATALVHAENGDVVVQMQEDLLAKGITGPEGHAYSRPPEVEGEAANRACMMADMAGCALYVVHTSCIPAHEAIIRARANGQRVYGEPLIQHLVLDESEYRHPDWDHAARRVMSPPFRAKHHQESLWHGLQSGSLQVVATDHCVFTTEQKRMGRGDFTKIPNGTGGLEDRMPVLWTHGVRTGRLTPSEFVAVTSANSAKILNCYPRKGVVAPGSDADIVVWDPEATKTISAKSQASVIDYNVFEGMDVKGLPYLTIARGKVVYKAKESQAPKGHGRFVARPPMSAVQRAMGKWYKGCEVRGVER
ncbi:MAG: dihydropyrimidinase [Geminicoccaceae bacterium]|nr:dihydropyrimidinase [Geminicoccaceae bacterium]